MFLAKATLKNVTSFSCSRDLLLYCQNFEQLFTYPSREKELFSSNKNLSDLQYNSDFFCNETNPGSGIIIKQDSVKRLEGMMIKALLSNGELLCSFKGSTVRYDLGSDVLIKILEYKVFTFLVVKTCLASFQNGEISYTSLGDGSKL